MAKQKAESTTAALADQAAPVQAELEAAAASEPAAAEPAIPPRRWWPEPPPSRMPLGEPPDAAVPDWAAIVPGMIGRPVKQIDGCWAAGGLVELSLCLSCIHRHAVTGSCTGPVPQSLRVTMTACAAYRARNR